MDVNLIKTCQAVPVDILPWFPHCLDSLHCENAVSVWICYHQMILSVGRIYMSTYNSTADKNFTQYPCIHHKYNHISE